MPKVLSLFSGVGTFDYGFQQAGFETIGFCEFDQKARLVLQARFPNIPICNDITEMRGDQFGVADVVMGGFPCQDVSVAGKRKGMTEGSETRSSLFFEAIRVVKEMREHTGDAFPRFVLVENVPGLLSSNGGRDFAEVVRSFLLIGARDVSWRVLDSRHFGVAQRRRRIFLVADFGGERAQEILFEPSRVRWDSTPGKAARQSPPAATGGGPESGGDLSAFEEYGFSQFREGVGTLRAEGGSLGGGSETLTVALDCRNSETTDELSGTLQAKANGGYSLNYINSVAYAVAENQRAELRLTPEANLTTGGGKPGQGYPAVLTQAHAHAIPILEVGKRTGTSTTDTRAGSGIGAECDPMYTLQASAQHGVACASAPAPCAAPTSIAISFQERGRQGGRNLEMIPDQAYALTAPVQGGRGQERNIAQPVGPHYVVRRLTPVECERLQSMPDYWTDVPGVSDTHRYRMMGNGGTASVLRFIAERMAAAL